MPKGARVFDGKRLKDIRINLGFRQEDFADIGIQQSQISKYENNKQEPTPDTMASIAKKLNITTDYLLGITDNPNEKLSLDTMSDDERDFLRLVDTLGAKRVKELLNKRRS